MNARQYFILEFIYSEIPYLLAAFYKLYAPQKFEVCVFFRLRGDYYNLILNMMLWKQIRIDNGRIDSLCFDGDVDLFVFGK